MRSRTRPTPWEPPHNHSAYSAANPLLNGTYRSAVSDPHPSDNRGPERSPSHPITGEVLRLEATEAHRIITAGRAVRALSAIANSDRSDTNRGQPRLGRLAFQASMSWRSQARHFPLANSITGAGKSS
jgi:hypothetical protein